MTLKLPRPRVLALLAALFSDGSAMVAVEFSLILPIMLVLFFGTVEMSNGVAAYRKVT